jgi:cell division protein FtsW (lipid II flippase)
MKISPRWKEFLLLMLAAIIPLVGWISVDLALQGRIVFLNALYPICMVGTFILAHLILRAIMPRTDPYILPLVAALCYIGIIFLFRLDTHLARLQLIWLAVGMAAMLVLVALLKDYRVLERYRYTLALIGLVLLLSTMVVGKEVNGARLWLVLGPLRFQPSELAKILLTIFFAAYLADRKELIASAGRSVMGFRLPRLRDLGPLLTMWVLSLLLLIFQKDLGSSLLFFGIFLAVIYVATARVSFVVVGVLLFIIGATVAFLAFPHVQDRVEAWVDPLNPETIDGNSYQIAQSLFAFSEGGLSGTGLARGYPEVIPFIETDFIYASIGEELGLFGAAAIILLFLMLVARGLNAALRSQIDFGKLLAVGLTAIIGLQAFIIMAGVTRLVPLTGITLPFISYGGSSLLSNSLLVGLLFCIYGGRREIAKKH